MTQTTVPLIIDHEYFYRGVIVRLCAAELDAEKVKVRGMGDRVRTVFVDELKLKPTVKPGVPEYVVTVPTSRADGEQKWIAQANSEEEAIASTKEGLALFVVETTPDPVVRWDEATAELYQETRRST